MGRCELAGELKRTFLFFRLLFDEFGLIQLLLFCTYWIMICCCVFCRFVCSERCLCVVRCFCHPLVLFGFCDFEKKKQIYNLGAVFRTMQMHTDRQSYYHLWVLLRCIQIRYLRWDFECTCISIMYVCITLKCDDVTIAGRLRIIILSIHIRFFFHRICDESGFALSLMFLHVFRRSAVDDIALGLTWVHICFNLYPS